MNQNIRDLLESLEEFQCSVKNQVPGSFRIMFDKIYPFWMEHMRFDNVNKYGFGFSDLALMDHRIAPGLFIVLNKFFDAVFCVDGDTVNAWVARIDEGIVKKPGIESTFFVPLYYKSTFPTEWLDYFVTRNRFNMTSVVEALDRGFHPNVVKLLNRDILHRLTPKVVDNFLSRFTPTVLIQLMKLDIPNRQYLTSEKLFTLADLGFTKASQVRDYARQFRIGFTDPHFYDRVIIARQNHPNLEEYIARNVNGG